MRNNFFWIFIFLISGCTGTISMDKKEVFESGTASSIFEFKVIVDQSSMTVPETGDSVLLKGMGENTLAGLMINGFVVPDLYLSPSELENEVYVFGKFRLSKFPTDSEEEILQQSNGGGVSLFVDAIAYGQLEEEKERGRSSIGDSVR